MATLLLIRIGRLSRSHTETNKHLQVINKPDHPTKPKLPWNDQGLETRAILAPHWLITNTSLLHEPPSRMHFLGSGPAHCGRGDIWENMHPQNDSPYVHGGWCGGGVCSMPRIRRGRPIRPTLDGQWPPTVGAPRGRLLSYQPLICLEHRHPERKHQIMRVVYDGTLLAWRWLSFIER